MAHLLLGEEYYPHKNTLITSSSKCLLYYKIQVNILNKNIKIIFAILIVGLIILPQNTKGAFGVEVNYQTAYRITEANYDVTVDAVSEVFSGYLLNGESS